MVRGARDHYPWTLSISFALAMNLCDPNASLEAGEGHDEAQQGIFSGKIVLCGTQHRSDQVRRIELLDSMSLQLQPFAVIKNDIPIAVRVAPNGKHLAVSVRLSEHGKTRTKLLLIDSENHRRTLSEGVEVVAWSPDSTRLLVRGGEKYAWSNSVIEIATGFTEKLPLPETDAVMDWSSDGSILSVMAGRPEKIFEQRPNEFYPKRQLYLFDLGIRNAQQPLTHPEEDCIKGRFSDDGTKLVYSRRTYNSGKPVELCEVIDLRAQTSSTTVNFTRLGVRANSQPVWSRDGQQVLWQVNRRTDDGNRQFEIWFVPSDGSLHRSVIAKELSLDFFGVMDWR